ncbi:alpha/beta hydrolase [Haloprofundus marisrubri]|uniref:Alpha/beta hydrolase n=1 Tax=Haloprofundus marisrubri TaxID=1514971 RepID=A0A0W1R9I0_9EURY|nr:alpha/beta hydrolase [Haloprofundus marisrubri]KTG10201.1 alpha/beta hydrolase [Haloprofundus marisrubri]
MNAADTVNDVQSSDGTEIVYERTGEGPPLVVVHGTAGDRTDWRPVLSDLTERFTVYAVDRRGRGDSGDAGEYALEREFEDVAAVVERIDEPVVLMGHSFGALCALEAALLVDNLERLILYEPPIPEPGERLADEESVARVEALLADGDHDAALSTFLREVAGESPEEVELLKSDPWWEVGLGAVHTAPREVRGCDEYRFDADRFAEFTAPTLLLSGGESPMFMKRATATVDKALPNSRIATFAGEGHEAITTAPDLFVETVFESLDSPE